MSETTYLEQIRQLVELQKVDDEIFNVKKILKDVPKNLADLEKQKNEIAARRNKIIDKLEYLDEQKKRVFNDISDNSEKLKKSDDKLMQIETSREYEAMMREKDSLEATSRMHEDEKSALLEELRIQNEAKDSIDKEFDDICQEFENAKSSIDSTLQAANEQLEKFEQQRHEACLHIPRPKLMRYEFIRGRLEHPVIVSVENGICSACHIAIPPQTFIELQSGQQILSCPNCQRLIFWNKHFEMIQSGEVKSNEQNEEPSLENISDTVE